MSQHPCVRCGLCCLMEPCRDAQHRYHIGRGDVCPALGFDDEGLASCSTYARTALVMMFEQGCSCSGALIAGEQAEVIESAPKEMKLKAAKQMRAKLLPTVFLRKGKDDAVLDSDNSRNRSG